MSSYLGGLNLTFEATSESAFHHKGNVALNKNAEKRPTATLENDPSLPELSCVRCVCFVPVALSIFGAISGKRDLSRPFKESCRLC